MNSETLITGVISTVIGGLIVYAITKNIPRKAYNWIKYHKISKNIIFRILPEKVINVPVDGRELTLVILNKNKDFDVDTKITLEFPGFLEIYKSSNFSFDDEFEFQMEDEIMDITPFEENINGRFKDRIRIASMSEWRATFKLLPKRYRESGNIIYRISLGIKQIDGKIKVNT